MKISRRSFSCGLLGAGVLVGAMPSAEKGSVRIAHLCDPQFGFVSGRESMKWRAVEHFNENYAEDIARCEKAIERINALSPDLLLFGGDMVQLCICQLKMFKNRFYVSHPLFLSGLTETSQTALSCGQVCI